MYQQPYHQYTIQHQQIWNILFTKRVEALSNVVAVNFWQGVKALDLKAYFIPEFQELNFWMQTNTDWQVVAVEQTARPAQVMAKWSKRKFPAQTQLRLHPDADLRLQGNSDLFLDIFSQLPWLLQPEVRDFMYRLGKLAQESKDAATIEALWQISQHVLGNGLLRDHKGQMTLLGSRLISNDPEGESALRHETKWQPLVLEELVATPFEEGKQPKAYFVLESLSDFTTLVERLESEGVPATEVSASLQMIAG
jgi:phenylalanine-4-hydroxylase